MYVRLELWCQFKPWNPRIDSINKMMSFVFSLIWITGIFGFYPSKVAFNILNHLTGRSESSWCQSGGLRSSDACTPEVLVKRFLLIILITVHSLLSDLLYILLSNMCFSQCSWWLKYLLPRLHTIVTIPRSLNLPVFKLYYVSQVHLERGFLRISKVFLMN